jgi:hypothetical protein
VELTAAAGLFAYHRGMLQDFDRVDAYRDAVHAVVRPGDVVVDIGTGTGLLAYFAAQAGARHVYAIEQGPIVALARELCQANGLSDRITFINDVSFRATLPELADVLITETLWNFGIGEGMIGFLADARERLLKPEARVVPSSVDLFLAPFEHAGLYEMLTRQPEDRHELNFSVMRRYALQQVLIPRVDPRTFVASPVHVLHVELDESAKPNFSAEATFHATRAGHIHALAGWFDSELVPGIRVGNAPPALGSSWAHTAFPLERPIPVEEGADLQVRIDTMANGTAWRWSVEGSGLRLDQTSVFGFPHDTMSHARRAAAARPRRAPLGEALRFVLDRLNGQTSVDEIAEQLADQHSGLFGQRGSAAQFVRETAEAYGA